MPENNDEPKTIHTYQSDVEKAIVGQDITKSKIFAVEQDREEEPKTPKPNLSGLSFNIRSVVIAILFLAIGGIGLYYFFKTPAAKIIPTPIVTPTEEQQIISYDSYVSLKLNSNTKEELLSFISAEKAKEDFTGIKVLHFGINSDQLLYLLGPNIPGIFVRALDPNFAYGFVRQVGSAITPSSFIILKVNSYSSARGSLLTEENNLAKEFADIFPVSDSTALKFKDKVIQNHDTRVLSDIQGKTHLLYSFIDSNTLVFTEDDDTFKIIIDRIDSSRR